MATDSLLLNGGGYLLLEDGGHLLLAFRPDTSASGGWRRQSGHPSPEPYRPVQPPPPIDAIAASAQSAQSTSGLFVVSVVARGAKISREINGVTGEFSASLGLQASSSNFGAALGLVRASMESVVRSVSSPVTSDFVASVSLRMSIRSDPTSEQTPDYDDD